jgi:hypothetical protein
MLSRADLKSAENLTMALMQQGGVDAYAVFLKSEKEKAYIPVVSIQGIRSVSAPPHSGSHLTIRLP